MDQTLGKIQESKQTITWHGHLTLTPFARGFFMSLISAHVATLHVNVLLACAARSLRCQTN
eukprot:4069861-Amphidinium_carterae.1